MKKISIKRISNIFKRNNKKYQSDIKYNNINYKICTVADIENAPYIDYGMPVITILFYDINPEDEDLYYFEDLASKYGLLKLLYSYGNTKGKNMYLTGNIYQILNMSSMNISNHSMVDNQYIQTMDKICKELDISYKGDIYSIPIYGKCDTYNSYDQYIDRVIRRELTSNIEIIGYTWINDKDKIKYTYDEDYACINYIWLSIDINLVRQFSSIRSYIYKDDMINKILIKIVISDLIDLLNNDNSQLSDDTRNTIKQIIFNGKSSSYKDISGLIFFGNEPKIDNDSYYKNIDEEI